VCALGGGGARGGGSFGSVSCGEVCVVCYSCVPQRAGCLLLFFSWAGAMPTWERGVLNDR